MLPSRWRKNGKFAALHDDFETGAPEEMDTAVFEAPTGDQAEDFEKERTREKTSYLEQNSTKQWWIMMFGSGTYCNKLAAKNPNSI